MPTTNTSLLLHSLTSIFTPDPACSSLVLSINRCDDLGCVAHQLSSYSYGLSCYPITTSKTFSASITSAGMVVPSSVVSAGGLATYSPGYFCPLGMTIATRIQSLDAACCCYSGYRCVTWEDDSPPSCLATFTEGTFLGYLGQYVAYSAISFGPGQTDQFQSWASNQGSTQSMTAPTIVAYDDPILLQGRQSVVGSSSISSLPTIYSSTSQASNNTSKATNGLLTPEDDARSSTSMQVLAGVGVSVGLISLIVVCLGFLFLKRYRRKRIGQLKNGDVLAEEEMSSNEYSDKPELQGSVVHRGPFIKAELDALAIRAEIEGSPGDEHEEVGLGILKPELHGTPGVPGRLGVFVKRKAELGASLNFGTISRAGPSVHQSV